MNRRDFFRRTVPAVALTAVAAPAVAMALGQPKRDAAGRIIVDGNEITVDGLDMPSEGLSIRARTSDAVTSYLQLPRAA